MSEQLLTHPWRDRHPNLPEGRGQFYHYGPNYTVDPIVLTHEPTPSILLIRRQDTGDWALPGGFIDEGEDPATAGRRELFEETSLILPTTDKPIIIYQGPVDDHRSTLHAWPETTALLWRIARAEPVYAGDDAASVRWMSINQLPEKLYGSHRLLAEKAIELITYSDGAASDLPAAAPQQ